VVLLPRAEHLQISQEVADKEAESRRTLLDNALWAQPTLGHDFLGKLSALLTRKVLSQGDIVVKQGAAVEEIYFVDEGELLVTVDLHCIRSPASAGAVAQSEGMSTPRGGAVTKRLPLASAVKFDCLGLLETLGKYGAAAPDPVVSPLTSAASSDCIDHRLEELCWPLQALAVTRPLAGQLSLGRQPCIQVSQMFFHSFPRLVRHLHCAGSIDDCPRRKRTQAYGPLGPRHRVIEWSHARREQGSGEGSRCEKRSCHAPGENKKNTMNPGTRRGIMSIDPVFSWDVPRLLSHILDVETAISFSLFTIY
jgi:hypothetical protein